MENLNEIIKQNYDIVIITSLIAIFIAGVIFKKVKIFSVILLILAFYALYTVVGYNKIKNIRIDDIKNKVKHRVIDNIQS